MLLYKNYQAADTEVSVGLIFVNGWKILRKSKSQNNGCICWKKMIKFL